MNARLQNFLQVIREPLAAMLPGLRIETSEPYYPTGVWIVNLYLQEYHLMVQFTDERGFGLSAGGDDWGTAVDEVVPDAGAAVMRVFELLRVKGSTIPTTTLQGLRANKTQREVAQAMDIRQPSYAKMENEELSKLKVHTLQKIVAASKGKLHLLVETGQGKFLILNSSTSAKDNDFDGPSAVFSGSVPLHLISFSPTKEECSIYKNAYAISSGYAMFGNVRPLQSRKYGSVWGGAPSNCLAEINCVNLTRGALGNISTPKLGEVMSKPNLSLVSSK